MKSLNPTPVAGVNGNGTVDVSWFTYASTLPPRPLFSEIPSGIDSNL